MTLVLGVIIKAQEVATGGDTVANTYKEKSDFNDSKQMKMRLNEGVCQKSEYKCHLFVQIIFA